MADDRTVLEHLLDGRNALLREVTRLNAAIEQLDTVLGRIGTGGSLTANGATQATVPIESEVATGTPTAEPVNSLAEVEPALPSTVPSRTRSTPRKAVARKTTSRSRSQGARSSSGGASTTTAPGEAPKSIRVHVLEMLAAENRDFGLAEIIDRVHGAGIQAHDDAVRSITIKLMKDGRVERVGRGQYRLARRGAAARAASAATATASRVTEAAPEPAISAPVTPPGENGSGGADSPGTGTPTYDNLTRDAGQRDDSAPPFGPTGDSPQTVLDETADDLNPSVAEQARSVDSDTSPAEQTAPEVDSESDETETVDEAMPEPQNDVDQSGSNHDAPEEQQSSGYVPPLNLGQPWNG